MKASELLKVKRWLRHELADTPNVLDPRATAYCMGGALMVAYDVGSMESDARKLAPLDAASAKIARYLLATKRMAEEEYVARKGDDYEPWFVLVDWNNRKAKTKEEVIDILEACGE